MECWSGDKLEDSMKEIDAGMQAELQEILNG